MFALLRNGQPIRHFDASDWRAAIVAAAATAAEGDCLWSGPCQPVEDSAAGDCGWRMQGNIFIGQWLKRGFSAHGRLYDPHTAELLEDRTIPYISMYGDGMNNGTR